VAALTANRVEILVCLLMVARICGTDNSIIRAVVRSRVASLLAMSSTRFFLLASFRVAGMLPRHGIPCHHRVCRSSPSKAQSGLQPL